MKSKLIVASLLAAASFSAFAADNAVFVYENPIQGQNTFIGMTGTNDPLFSDGLDTITFYGQKLTSSVYNVVVSLSGQNVTFGAQSTLNGATGEAFGSGKFRFFGIETTGVSPFTLNLFGTTTSTSNAMYSGEVTISPVPEPETYGMLMAGLGLLGFMARRKAAKKSV